MEKHITDHFTAVIHATTLNIIDTEVAYRHLLRQVLKEPNASRKTELIGKQSDLKNILEGLRIKVSLFKELEQEIKENKYILN